MCLGYAVLDVDEQFFAEMGVGTVFECDMKLRYVLSKVCVCVCLRGNVEDTYLTRIVKEYI